MIEETLSEVLAYTEVPSMVALFTSSNGILAIEAVGVCKIWTDPKLGTQDLIHLGYLLRG